MGTTLRTGVKSLHTLHMDEQMRGIFLCVHCAAELHNPGLDSAHVPTAVSMAIKSLHNRIARWNCVFTSKVARTLCSNACVNVCMLHTRSHTVVQNAELFGPRHGPLHQLTTSSQHLPYSYRSLYKTTTSIIQPAFLIPNTINHIVATYMN